MGKSVGIPIVHYARSIQTAWLGNQLAVQFFVLAAPTILKSHRAHTGTLALFASLSLLWCLRGVVVPALLAILPRKNRQFQLLWLILLSRLAIILLFVILALYSIDVMEAEALKKLLFTSGVFICTISGLERGFLEVASVFAANTQQKTSALRLALAESTGIVLAWVFCNGVVLPAEDYFGTFASAFVAAILIGGFSVPLFLTILRRSNVQSTHDHEEGLSHAQPNIDAHKQENSHHNSRTWVWWQTLELAFVLIFGWLGMDLAWRISQPLLVHQGITLTSTGVVGVCMNGLLLILSALVWRRTEKLSDKEISFRRACEILGLFAVSMLSVAGFLGGTIYAIIGYMVLQFSYFCFTIFTMELLIRCGQTLKAPSIIVSVTSIAYSTAHAAVIPILYFSSHVMHAYGLIALLAGIILVIWQIGVRRILSMTNDSSRNCRVCDLDGSKNL
ncbi:hypothetical protein [Gluconobacter sphaericus]|uniref:hypothetical protein n=1 Tax=Gluconobacter sphaericus TaxID=574987 RepID=UPI001B8B3175|nr:hypothetical protein [Gluconobacter sphaericus]MBS1087262.1 hypothetical protein [Gluconobacter sphaericus]MBS1101312.1 hypothetical protein [Gluconobacter sphaericus]